MPVSTSTLFSGVAWCSNSAAWLSSGSNSFLRAASNVGIGTARPAFELDVSGTGRFSSNVLVGSNLVITGDIMPTGNHTQNIGSSNNRFGTAWVDTLHIASNTLYLGTTPVLGTSGTTVNITADVDQSINITTTGVGATQLTSAGEVDISTSGINGNVKINANGAGGQVTLGSTTAVVVTAPTTNVGGAMTVSSNLTVNGDLSVNGMTGTLNVTTLQVKDNIVLLNMGQTGNGVSLGTAGFRVARGDLADFNVIFSEASGGLSAGPVGSELPIATQAFAQAAQAFGCNTAVYASNASASMSSAQAAFGSNLALTWQASPGKANVVGVLSASNPVFFSSNLTVLGTLTTQNLDYIYSNVTVYASETIQSNLTVQTTTMTSNLAVGSNAAFALGASFSNAAVGVGGALNVAGTAWVGGNAVVNKQLVLWDALPSEAAANASNFYGFGVNASVLRYQAPVTNTHKWYSGSTNTMVLDGSGNLTATANVLAYSDARLKDDVVRIEGAMDKIGRLGGYTFVRNDIPGESGVRSTGVIAQEVLAVLPEAVRVGDDGMLSVSYGNMVGLLVEGLKELAARNAALEARLNLLS